VGQLGHVPLAAALLADPAAATQTAEPAAGHLVVRVLGQVTGALAAGDGGGHPGHRRLLACRDPGPGVGAGGGAAGARAWEGTAEVEVLHGSAEGFAHCGGRGSL